MSQLQSDRPAEPVRQAPVKTGHAMGLAMLACAAMCGLPLLIASASVLAAPLLGPAALLIGGVAVAAVVLWRRRRTTCPTGVADRRDAQ